MANPESGPRRRARLLAAIAAFKLAKAVACGLLATAAFRLLQPAFAVEIEHRLEALHWLTRYGLAASLTERLLGLGGRQFLLLGLVATAYAALYLVQGIGLWRGRRWAEYLVVVEGALLLPLEIWELWQRFTVFKLGVLCVNLAIVAYLVRLLGPARSRWP